MELWLEFVYALWSWGVEEQMLIFSSSLMPGRVKGPWNTIPKLIIVLVWKIPVCLKFGETSNVTVQNLPQRKLWAGTMHVRNLVPPNFGERVLLWKQ